MNNLSDMIWIELRKAIRSGMPLWTALGSLFMPLGIGFLIFVARNPDVSAKLGLISAKANLMAYSATDWPTYLKLSGQIVAAGGFVLFVIVISWIFGREFADGTLKDMLAVPVSRASIILAKFIAMAIWSLGLVVEIYLSSLVMGALIKLPGVASGVIFQGSDLVLGTALLTIVAVTPFALFASIGRGYLLPMGVAVLMLMMTNLVALIGWGEYFPWAVAGLYVQGTDLAPVSFWIVVFTGLAGMLVTYLWWMRADQSR